MQITIFEFLKENYNSNLFVNSPFFFPLIEELENIFESLEDEKDKKLFYLNQNSLPDFVNVRFLILVKKFLGEDKIKDIYKYCFEKVYFVREFMIKNRIEESSITIDYFEKFKKQRNFELLKKADFKAEDILYEELYKELNEKIEENQKPEKKDDESSNSSNQKIKEKIEKKEYEIKNNELVIYSKDGKVIKRTDAYITKCKKLKPFIKDYIELDGFYYYLGKFNFGEAFKIDEKNDNIKEILLKLIKKIKGE